MKPSSGFAGLVLLAGMAAGTAHAQTYSQFWPYLPDGGGWETFIRHTIVNGSSTLTLVLVNENGQLAGRHELRVDAGKGRHVNSRTLRNAGAAAGPWWALATWTGRPSPWTGRPPPPPQLFLRTSGGFVVPLGTDLEDVPSSQVRNLASMDSRFTGMQWGIRGFTLNPGHNTNQVGMLRIANISRTQSSRVAFVTYDDEGGIGVGITTLAAGSARGFRASEIEQIAGVQPRGKWRVAVLSTEILVGQTGIWSRPTGLYAPTSVHVPRIVPLSGNNPALSAEDGTEPFSETERLWDIAAQGLAAHLTQDVAASATDTTEPSEPVEGLDALQALFSR